VAHPTLVDKSRIYLPSPQSKLRLIKISVKVMDKESEGFAYLRQKFPKTSEAKMKAGIYGGPQIKQLFDHQYFSPKLYRRKSLEGIWKHLQKISRQWENWKLEWNCTGGIRRHRNFIFCILIWISLMKTWEMSPMNMANSSIRIFPKWERSTVENGITISCLILA